VISNHRCHGHYIAKTGKTHQLLKEILGRESGVNSGFGGSQHLYDADAFFYTNGIQGAFLPSALGIAMSEKQMNTKNICVAYIGDGTWGEGIVYETLNLAGLIKCPLLIIVEDNEIAQTTLKSNSLSGSIKNRVLAFNIDYFESESFDFKKLDTEFMKSIDYVRNNKITAVHLVKTIRLNSHSKGDDTRHKTEIDRIKLLDPIYDFYRLTNGETIKLIEEKIFNRLLGEINAEIPFLDSLDLSKKIRIKL
jgi:2-oxoisovalerate dehydrogenase E1 component